MGCPPPGLAEMRTTPAAGGSRGCGEEAPLPLEGLHDGRPHSEHGIWHLVASGTSMLARTLGPEGLLLGTCLS